MTDTKEKILDTAERLIGEQGYAATSLRHVIAEAGVNLAAVHYHFNRVQQPFLGAEMIMRHVIAEAGVNLAAVHYHFGSKEGLLDAVVTRKVTPVNLTRLAWLERVETEAGGGPVEVEKILESFLLPTVEVAARSPDFVRLMGQMLAEGMMPRIVEKHFRPTGIRFVTALRRALPGLPEEELLWRGDFMRSEEHT